MSCKTAKPAQRRGCSSFLGCLRQFLTPQLFKQARQAAGAPRRCRWEMQPLLLVLCTMTWCTGDNLAERFEVARAFYVALHPKRRRPGKTARGFSQARQRLPVAVLRLVATTIRLRLLQWGTLLYNGSWIVFGC